MRNIALYIIHYTLYITIAFAITSCTSSTKPKTGSLSGRVILVNDTGATSLDPVDYSGVTVALYELAQLDTTIVRINSEYLSVGVNINQETEFDHRTQAPLYTTITDEAGGFSLSSIPGRIYNMVFYKEHFGWGYKYGVDINSYHEYTLYGEIVLDQPYYDYVNVPDRRHAIVAESTTINRMDLGASSWVRLNTNSRLSFLSNISTNVSNFAYIVSNDTIGTGGSITFNSVADLSLRKIIFRRITEAVKVINCQGNIGEIRFDNCSTSITANESDISIINTIATKDEESGSIYATDSSVLKVFNSILSGSNIALDIRNGSDFYMHNSHIQAKQCIYLDAYTTSIIDHNLLAASEYAVKSDHSYLINITDNDIVSPRGIYIRSPLITADHSINYNNFNTSSYALENTPNLIGDWVNFHFNASYNFYYTTDAHEVAAKIFDRNDIPEWALFYFQFTPFLTSFRDEAGIQD